MTLRLLISMTLSPLIILLLASDKDRTWPIVSNNKFVMKVKDADKDAVGFDKVIKNSRGYPAYVISCGTPFYEGSRSFEFSGVAQCYFAPIINGGIGRNLLSEDKTSDWSNRGRFLYSALRDACFRDKIFGARRSFDFRNIEVVISISDVVFIREKIKSYVLTAMVSRKVGIRNAAIKSESGAPKWYLSNNCPLGK